MYEPNEIDYAVVRALCLYGASHDEIANFIGISRNTLLKYYKEDLLDNCKEDKNGAVEKSLYYNCVVRKSVEAQKYWLSNHNKEKYGEKSQQSGNTDAVEILREISENLPD